MAVTLPSLAQLTRALRRQHGAVKTPPPKNAFEWVLWDNVAYLADDERRSRAFALLKTTIGLTPDSIARASNPSLLAVTRHGIAAPLFARKLRAAAEIARDRFGGRIERALDADAAKAIRQLRAFPGIGEPGAEKILVAIGRARSLPLDSNGLRVLLRIGFGQASRSYANSFKSAKAALPVGRTSAKTLFATHLLLQRHGREVCKASVPECGWCQLRPMCRHGSARAADTSPPTPAP